jgi:hypothetical protein
MRPLELALVLLNLVTLGVLAVPQLHAVRWTGYVAVIAVLIAIAQIIVEGPRWQMVPAYMLTGLFFLVWLMQNTALAGRPVNRLAAGLAIGLGTMALVISAALPIVSPVFRFPRPGGPYAIGTLTYHWVDAARPELFTADPRRPSRADGAGLVSRSSKPLGAARTLRSRCRGARARAGAVGAAERRAAFPWLLPHGA